MTTVVSNLNIFSIIRHFVFSYFDACLVKMFDMQCIWCDFLGLQLPSAFLSTRKLVRHYHWAD